MYRGTWKVVAAFNWYPHKAGFVMMSSSYSVSHHFTSCSFLVLFAHLTLLPCRWRQQVPPKCWHQSAISHGVISQKTLVLVVSAVKTWNVRLTLKSLNNVWNLIN
jgi:hypothetical protein